MHTHKEKRDVPFTDIQMFDLVADVAKYPEFLPWCIGTRIRKEETVELTPGLTGKMVTADLIIRFKMFREMFTSQVTLDRLNRSIVIEYLDGPFKHLENKWHFEPNDAGCSVDFYIDFEFRSRVLAKMMNRMFHDAVHKMVLAFETRAHALYGETSSPIEKEAGAAAVSPT